jgi:hypothetical protein
MVSRAAAIVLLAFAVVSTRAQDVFNDSLNTKAPPKSVASSFTKLESAWIDLRQVSSSNSKPQDCPAWVEAISIVPGKKTPGLPETTVFRIRVLHPNPEAQVLFCRLFFDDNAEQKPQLTAWDESGTVVTQSGPLGAGIGLPTSETVMVPMVSASTIDIEVPGDGQSVRGAYLDWMTHADVVHPSSAEHRDLIPEPFAAMPPLHPVTQDSEQFGTVTASLADETIRIGASVSQGAAFQFGLESQPLVALITFEVASPNIAAPPEIFVNGENLGPVSITLPDLADPAYRGQTASLLRGMRFQYTGWLRAQKLVPASNLRAGTNDILITSGDGTAASAIRSTQIQLKYLWDKSDYQLQTDR